MVESRCGLICTGCTYKESHGCGGCIETSGNPFHGECPVAQCCQNKGLLHCGQCPDMPCDLLSQYSYDEEHGDNGKRIEICRIWASYPGISICDITADEVINALKSEKSIVLSTSADNRTTTRTMSHVNDGLTVYFQTGKDYLKCRQIRSNPNVAISVGGFDIEGRATILGHPLDAENSLFAKLFKEKHNEYMNGWSERPEEIVVKVEIGLVKQCRYIDGKPFIAIGQFAA